MSSLHVLVPLEDVTDGSRRSGPRQFGRFRVALGVAAVGNVLAAHRGFDGEMPGPVHHLVRYRAGWSGKHRTSVTKVVGSHRRKEQCVGATLEEGRESA